MGFVGGGLAIQNPDKQGLYNGGSRLNSVTDYKTRIANPYRIDASAPLAPISNIHLRNVVDEPLGWQELSMMPTPGTPNVQRPLGLRNDVKKQLLHPGYHDQNSFEEKPKPSGGSLETLPQVFGNSMYTPEDPFSDANRIDEKELLKRKREYSFIFGNKKRIALDDKSVPLKRKRESSFIFGDKKKIALDDTMETLNAGEYPNIPKPLSGGVQVPGVAPSDFMLNLIGKKTQNVLDSPPPVNTFSPAKKMEILKAQLQSIATPFGGSLDSPPPVNRFSPAKKMEILKAQLQSIVTPSGGSLDSPPPVYTLSPARKMEILKAQLKSIVTPFGGSNSSSSSCSSTTGACSPNKFITQDIGKRKRSDDIFGEIMKKSRTDKGLRINTSVKKFTKKPGEKVSMKPIRIPVVRTQRKKK